MSCGRRDWLSIAKRTQASSEPKSASADTITRSSASARAKISGPALAAGRSRRHERHRGRRAAALPPRTAKEQCPRETSLRSWRQRAFAHGFGGVFQGFPDFGAREIRAGLQDLGFGHPGSRREKPQVLACMHGSAWRRDGAVLIRALAKNLEVKAMARPLAA